MRPLPSRLYVIGDEQRCRQAGWTLPDFCRACFDAGARLVQLRAKTLGGAAFLDLAAEVVECGRQNEALVIVNDRADIARLASAGGVHVGQDDVPPAGVRKTVGDRAVVGLSTHTLAQLTDAMRQPVDYVAVGPVYGTLTKVTGHQPVGLGHVAAAALTAGARVPLVAIGGITVARAAATVEAGAAAVAVIADLLSAGDPAKQVRAFLRALE